MGEECWKSQPLEPDFVAAHDLVVILTDHSGVDYARVVDLAVSVFDTRNATRDVPAAGEKVRKL